MTTVISIFFLIIFVWTGHSGEWMVDYATGLAQLAIWCTLASLVPFLSLWVSLKESSFGEIPRTHLRTHWSSFLKYSSLVLLAPLASLGQLAPLASLGQLALRPKEALCLKEAPFAYRGQQPEKAYLYYFLLSIGLANVSPSVLACIPLVAKLPNKVIPLDAYFSPTRSNGAGDTSPHRLQNFCTNFFFLED